MKVHCSYILIQLPTIRITFQILDASFRFKKKACKFTFLYMSLSFILSWFFFSLLRNDDVKDTCLCN